MMMFNKSINRKRCIRELELCSIIIISLASRGFDAKQSQDS